MAEETTKKKSALSLLEIGLFGKTLPWYWTPIFVATLLVSMHLMVKLQIKDATFSFLDAFSEWGDGAFKNSSYSLGGRLESTDLTITPDESEPSTVIRIPRVSMQTPGFFWLLRRQIPSFKLGWSIFGGKSKLKADHDNQYPPTGQLSILFERIDWGDVGMQAVLPDVSWVGAYSGAAFEAAGCSEDWWWHRNEFADKFKMAEPAGNISLLFRTEGEQILVQTLEFGSPETSHAIIERRFELPQADDFLDTPAEEWRTMDVRWSFRDHGFNKARNRYCAQQAGITEAEFIERHIAVVERLMATKGNQFPRAMWLAYKRYAEGGKELVWQSNYGEGVAWEDINSKRGVALLEAINASVHVEGFPRVPYQPTGIPIKPLPEDGDYASVYQVLQMENGGSAVPISPLAEPTAVPAGAPAAVAASGLLDPATVPTVTTAGTALVAAPAGVTTSEALPGPPPLSAGIELPSRELGKHLGIYVRVELSNGRSYVGAVASSGAEAVTLSVRMRSGQASLALPHKRIRRVTTM